MEDQGSMRHRVLWVVKAVPGVTIARVDEILTAALAVVVVVPFGHLFIDYSFLWLVAPGAGLALLISCLMSPSRRPIVTLLVSWAGLLLYLALVVYHILLPTGTSLRQLWDGLTGSWSQTLSASVPAVPAPNLTVLPVLIAWVATYLGVELGLRTRWIGIPVVPPLAAFVLTLMFTGKQIRSSFALPIVVLVLVLAVILVRANLMEPAVRDPALPSGSGVATDRRVSLPPLRMGILLVVGIALIAVMADRVLPAGSVSSRFDLHDYYRPPVHIDTTVSPLAEIRAGLTAPSNSKMFNVQFSSVGPSVSVDHIPVAVLDQYDGSVWGDSGAFAMAGKQLPPQSPPSVPTATIRQSYQILSNYRYYGTVFLPALERPVSVTGSALAFDRSSGTLATTASSAPGLSYGVTSQVPEFPEWKNGTLSGSDVRPGNDPTVSLLALPPSVTIPPPIMSFESSVQPRGPGDLGWLQGLQGELNSSAFGYSSAARPGHSVGRIADFLDISSASVNARRIGSSEQFAAAFALLARIRGLPSRVVVGYTVDGQKAAEGAMITVTASDIVAWPEVNLNGIGWVPFPINTTSRPAPPPPNQNGSSTSGGSTTPTTLPTIVPNTVPGSHAGLGPGKRVASRASFWWLYLVLLLVLVAPLAIVLLKRLRRGRRMNASSDAGRVMGAWREARDHLRQRGIPVSRAMTVTDVVDSCHHAADAELASRVWAFGPIVDAALFAPYEPDPRSVAQAWEAEQAVAASVKEHSNALQRLRGAVDPRPLIGTGDR